MKGSLGVGATLVLIAAAAAFVLWPKSEVATGPEPIHYGRDTCARCRMKFGGPGMGGERRTKEGKIEKFDDIGCLLLGMWASHQESPGVWVEDHAGTGFVPLLQASLVVGDKLETPMGYGIVAFADSTAAEKFAGEKGAKVVPLEELLRDRTRFSRQHAENQLEGAP